MQLATVSCTRRTHSPSSSIPTERWPCPCDSWVPWESFTPVHGGGFRCHQHQLGVNQHEIMTIQHRDAPWNRKSADSSPWIVGSGAPAH